MCPRLPRVDAYGVRDKLVNKICDWSKFCSHLVRVVSESTNLYLN